MTTRIIILLMFSLGTLYAAAQVASIHWPHNGDRVVKTQYEFVPVDADSAIWDFSHAVETGRERTMLWVNIGDSILVKIEENSQHTYRMQGDTLLWAGHESALLGMRDSIAPIMMLPGMTIGDSVATPYYFKGKYSGNHAVDMTGIHVVQLKSLGTLILPNDTLTGVLLVRELTDGKARVSPHQADTAISADQDSLLRHVTLIDRWYSPWHRYPVAENVTNILYSHNTQLRQSCATYLCPPDVQELALGSTFPTPQRSPRGHSSSSHASSAGDILPLTDRLTVSVGDSQVGIALSGVEGTSVSVVLSDIMGRVWYSYAAEAQESIWQGNIDTSALPTGDYLLHVAAGEDTHVEKFRIR